MLYHETSDSKSQVWGVFGVSVLPQLPIGYVLYVNLPSAFQIQKQAPCSTQSPCHFVASLGQFKQSDG